MKTLSKKSVLTLLIFGAICFPLLCATVAFAGEGTPGWRKVYDNVMLIVNFGILVFFFIKYAKNPMMKALHGVRKNIAGDFDKIHGQKDESKSKRDTEAQKLKDIEKFVEEIKKNILEMAEREKEKIIEDGRVSAEKMIQDAHNYADYRVETAKKALSDEMVDMAIAMVEEKLKKGVTDKDNEKIVNQFVNELQVSPALVK